MVLILFLIDTSASMNQRTCLGTTYLDIAKGAVESFMKIRSRDQAARGDRYMLVSFDEPPNCIKAGWRESPAIFLEELKSLQAASLSGLGPALKESFNLLSLHRLQSGIDNYGMGRNPYYLEPAIIVAITDNGKLSNTAGVLPELHLPMHNQLSGSELTKEPFRWDQRMYSLILRISGSATGLAEKFTPNQFNVDDDTPITRMCDATGGRSYGVSSHKTLMQSLESIAQKIQPGVVIQFDQVGPNPEPVSREGARTPGDATPKPEETIDCMDIDQENKPLIGQPIVNGIIPSFDVLKNNTFQPIKSEGQDTSSQNVLENPVRGDEAPQPVQDFMQENITAESTLATSTAWHKTIRMIYVRSNPKVAVGHWPIPESFWPDPGATAMPARDAHPNVLFSCTNADPMVVDNLPFDKYELEPSPLTQFILERKQPNYCWQTFVSGSGSGRGGPMGQPFGYLKASTNLQSVNLFVMPYNYPILLPLIEELFKIHKCKPSMKWKESFELYLQTMPSYYAAPLRNALRRMGAPSNLVPDHIDGSLSFSIITYLKKVKHQAKLEADRLISLVGKKPARDALNRPLPQVPQINDDKQWDYRSVLLRKTSILDPKKSQRNSNKKSSSDISLNLEDRGLPYPQEHVQTQSFKNPFDIPREKLIEQLRRMKLNFFHTATASKKFEDEDQKHFMAIGQMGNYQEYLKMVAPLREVDPGQSRLHAFGNPFKLKQDHQLYAVDEADVNEAMAGPGMPPKKRSGDSSFNNNKKRRKNETPPPSRRPQGLPNVPPPRPVTPPVKVPSIKVGPQVKDVISVNDILEEKIELEEAKEKEVEKLEKIRKVDKIMENGISPEKRSVGKSVHKQLRKLQEMHKNKLSKTVKHDKIDTNKGVTLNNDESPSPILSILRTSFVNEDKIKTQDITEDGEVELGKKRKQGGMKKNEIPAKRAREDTVSPATSRLSERSCRLLLQSHRNSKLRLNSWKEIRNITDRNECFKTLEKLVNQIEGPSEVKSLFVKDIIEEVERFKITPVCDKLKILMQNLDSGSVEATGRSSR